MENCILKTELGASFISSLTLYLFLLVTIRMLCVRVLTNGSGVNIYSQALINPVSRKEETYKQLREKVASISFTPHIIKHNWNHVQKSEYLCFEQHCLYA